MKILPTGELDRETLHTMKLIETYSKIEKYALRLGLCYNDDIVTFAHNEAAFWWQKIEKESDYRLLVKIWKDGTVHVYDRAKYLAGKKGTRWSGTR